METYPIEKIHKYDISEIEEFLKYQRDLIEMDNEKDSGKKLIKMFIDLSRVVKCNLPKYKERIERTTIKNRSDILKLLSKNNICDNGSVIKLMLILLYLDDITLADELVQSQNITKIPEKDFGQYLSYEPEQGVIPGALVSFIYSPFNLIENEKVNIPLYTNNSEYYALCLGNSGDYYNTYKNYWKGEYDSDKKCYLYFIGYNNTDNNNGMAISNSKHIGKILINNAKHDWVNSTKNCPPEISLKMTNMLNVLLDRNNISMSHIELSFVGNLFSPNKEANILNVAKMLTNKSKHLSLKNELEEKEKKARSRKKYFNDKLNLEIKMYGIKK